MKLNVILSAVLVCCFVITTNAQQSTLKTTRKSITTLKSTTTPKPKMSTTTTRKLTTTTTRKPTTTRKLNATTTTVKRNVTTTKPSTIPIFSLCRDTNSSSVTGQIKLVKNTTTSPCTFDIIAPLGQQIQISCSVVFFDDYSSILTLHDAIEMVWPLRQPVANRIYYSVENTLSLYSKFAAADVFVCKWNTAPKENTTKFNLCRHGQASSANGTIQPMMAANSSDQLRSCVFTITAPPQYQIVFSCSVVNLTSLATFQVDGTSALFYVELEINQTYYSTVQNEVSLMTTLGKEDWIDCKWTTARRENNKTNFKLCRDGDATAGVGTITPTGVDKMPPGGCTFLIKAPHDQQIAISCSASNISDSTDSYLTIGGLTEYNSESYDFNSINPMVNETYYSSWQNLVLLSSKVSNSRWFSCNWTTTRKENKTNVKFCRDEESSSPNGTILILRPVGAETTPWSACYFAIGAPSDQQITISCSSVSLNGDGYFAFDGLNEPVDPYTSVVNRVYYSTSKNVVYLYAQIDRRNDWLNCSWSILPKRTTTHFELCRDVETTSAQGTITPLQSNPLEENWYQKSRSCAFIINALPNQQIEFSCSVLDLDSSQIRIYGITGRFSNLVLNRKYYSDGSYLYLIIEVNDSDWFNCKWIAVPRANKTAKSLTQLLPV